MLTTEQCNKILKENDEIYTNEEIELIREFLYNYSHIATQYKEEQDDDE